MDGGEEHAHEHLAGTGPGVGDLGHREDLGRVSETGLDECAHGCLSLLLVVVSSSQPTRTARYAADPRGEGQVTHVVRPVGAGRHTGRMTPEPKTCQSCGRTIEWRKKWERDWDQVRYCSTSCRKRGVSEVDRRLEAAITDLLAQRARSATICPSDAARLVGDEDTWRDLMEPAGAPHGASSSAARWRSPRPGTWWTPRRRRARSGSGGAEVALSVAFPGYPGKPEPPPRNFGGKAPASRVNPSAYDAGGPRCPPAYGGSGMLSRRRQVPYERRWRWAVSEIAVELARVKGAFAQPTLTLLHQRQAPVVITIFRAAFGRNNRPIPTARLHTQVEEHLAGDPRVRRDRPAQRQRPRDLPAVDARPVAGALARRAGPRGLHPHLARAAGPRAGEEPQPRPRHPQRAPHHHDPGHGAPLQLRGQPRPHDPGRRSSTRRSRGCGPSATGSSTATRCSGPPRTTCTRASPSCSR